MSKLWAKNYQLDSLIEEFTVGIDYILDQKLIPSDCAASLAHAEMLGTIGILTDEEIALLKGGLLEILELHARGEFPISRSDEDGHTAIENWLTAKIGDAGKKIHTGRSRNDQVVTTIRVYLRSMLLEVMETGLACAEATLDFARLYRDVPMPGRTHTQIAMPSSVGLWAGAWVEQLLDDIVLAEAVWELTDQWPLGAAAGYGVPIPLNREMTAGLMGFSRVQNNVIYVNNSRGKLESMVLDAFDQIGITLSKIAQDLILFSLPELGYFSLPDKLCTGSSIMPQKKNPDGLELMRAKSATLSACAAQVKNIIRSQVSGYNRDYQETKEPFLKGCDLVLISLKMIELTFRELKVNEKRLKESFTPEIYATDAAIELTLQGMSFRDAYKEVGLNLDKLGTRNPADTLKTRTSTGTPGNPRLDVPRGRIESMREGVEERKERIGKALRSLLGREISLL
jgi:argininosuccinate lyase